MATRFLAVVVVFDGVLTRHAVPWRSSLLPWTGIARPRHASVFFCKAPDHTDPTQVNLPGLKAEAARRLLRSEKKLQKAAERAAACKEQQDALFAMDDPPLPQLEALPDCDQLAATEEEERARTEQLRKLVELLAPITSVDDAAFGNALRLAQSFAVKDRPPDRPVRGPRRPKGPPPSREPRLPYRVFQGSNGAEIRVGRTAKENDRLSCDPEHREGNDFWMHAAGCPGSHVVIRASTIEGDELPKDVELDAAVLAANYSKATLTGTVQVTLCRARQVSKPPGAKPGLVRIAGSVRTVRVNWQRERHRLERLAANGGDGQQA